MSAEKMIKRNLFAELREAVEAMKQRREGKQTLLTYVFRKKK